MDGQRYTAAERESLGNLLPAGVRLLFDMPTNVYKVLFRPADRHTSILLTTVPRREVLKWRPNGRDSVMSYVARRALKEARYAAEFRVAGQDRE